MRLFAHLHSAAERSSNLGESDPARPQDTRLVRAQIENRRGLRAGYRSGIEYEPHSTSELPDHLSPRTSPDLAGAIRAGSGKGTFRPSSKIPHQRGARQTHRHRTGAGRHGCGHTGGRRKHQRQRTGPEPFGQRSECRRKPIDKAWQHVEGIDQQENRLGFRAALGAEQIADRLRIPSIREEPV